MGDVNSLSLHEDISKKEQDDKEYEDKDGLDAAKIPLISPITIVEPGPYDVLKTVLCGLFMGCGSLTSAISYALVHESIPDYDPLPDVVLNNLEYKEWGLIVSECLLVANLILAMMTVLSHSHRLVIFRRIFIILGLLFFYRSVTIYITALPKPNVNKQCAPKLNHTITFSELIPRVLLIAGGGGLSLGWDQVFCGDYIFSGHTTVLLMSYFIVKEYSPQNLHLLHILSMTMSASGIMMLLLARVHYSIDCLISYWITSRVWWTYHTIANEQNLKIPGNHNYMQSIWWWKLLIWAEANVPCKLQNCYSFLSLDQTQIQKTFLESWARRGQCLPVAYQKL